MENSNWLADSVIYQIFLDRFAGFEKSSAKDLQYKPEFCGGNLRGVKDKIPYLKELGIDCIWLTPFFKGTFYHGYHIEDFDDVDPHFGNKDDLHVLIDKCHSNGIKVIMDFVANHCSENHPYFRDAQKNKDSKYYRWFTFNNWPHHYMSFLDFHEIPKINLKNKQARDYMIDSAIYWIKDFGFDGIRLDHVIGPETDFWKEFVKRIKIHHENVAIIGEACFAYIEPKLYHTLKVGNIKKKQLMSKLTKKSMHDLLMKEYEGITDGSLDFTFCDLAKEFFAKRLYKNSEEFWNKVIKHYAHFNENFILPSFLDNHDMNRFLFDAEGDKKSLVLASLFQFSLSQPPIIYYGTEIGLSQDRNIHSIKNHGDLQARKIMEWDKEKQDIMLLEHYKTIIELRKKHISLRRGKIGKVITKKDSLLIGIEKIYGDEKTIIIINPDKIERNITLEIEGEETFVELMPGDFYIRVVKE